MTTLHQGQAFSLEGSDSETNPADQRPLPWSIKSLFALILEAVRHFLQHNGPSYAAAIAYHTIISLGPLLYFSILIAGTAFGRAAAIDQLEATIRTIGGETFVEQIRHVVVAYREPTVSRTLTTWISAALLLYAASNVFRQLVIAQNAIWEVAPPTIQIRDGLWRWLRIRLRLYVVSIITSLIIIFALLASMILSLVAGLLLQLVGLILPALVAVLKWASLLLIPLFFIGLCLLGFRQLPAVKPPWRAVLPGAIATGLIMAVGEGLIVYYATHNPIPTFFGLAGSVVIVMVWAYISALIFLFGAEFTRLFATWQAGKRVVTADTPAFVRRLLEDQKDELFRSQF